MHTVEGVVWQYCVVGEDTVGLAVVIVAFKEVDAQDEQGNVADSKEDSQSK